MKRILLFLTALLAACGGDPYRGVYEGIQNRNDSMKTPIERATSPSPSYDVYKKEREQPKPD